MTLKTLQTYRLLHDHNIFSPSIEIQPPTPQKQKHKIRHNERRKDPTVSPTIIEADLELVVELITDFESTVLAYIGHVVLEISVSARFEERRHVLAARTVVWGWERVVFSLSTIDVEVVKFCNNHATD